MSLHITGITRFSLVHPMMINHFAATRGKSLSKAQSIIWEKSRMEARLSLLRHFAIPTYASIEKQHENSSSVFVISESMPGYYKELLKDAIAPLKNACVKEISDDQDVWSEMTTTVADLAGGNRLFCFRLDDDDALFSDFAHVVAKFADENEDETFLVCDEGFQFGRYGPDAYRVYRRVYPRIALGLGTVSSRKSYYTPFRGNHTKIEERFRVVHYKDKPAWLRSTHHFNDSDSGQRVINRPDLTLDEACSILEPHFDIPVRDALLNLPIRSMQPER